MKGIELPISTLIIIVIALLVLIGIVALWMGGWIGGATGISVEAAKAAGCGALMRDKDGCTTVNPDSITYDGGTEGVPRFDVDGDGDTDGDDDLLLLCGTYYDASTASDCRQVCGCSE